MIFNTLEHLPKNLIEAKAKIIELWNSYSIASCQEFIKTIPERTRIFMQSYFPYNVKKDYQFVNLNKYIVIFKLLCYSL